MTIFLGILIFGFLIFIHELGHFLTARLFSVRVNAFSIGMGPAIFKKKRGEVEYALRLLPIGGYVSLEGEDGDSEDARAFSRKPPLQRLLILFSGGFMNILCGFLIFLILFGMTDQIRVPVVDAVVADTPAAESGIMPGDRIVKINGRAVHIQNDVTLALMKNGEKTASIEVRRNDGTRATFSVKPKYSAENEGYVIGFYPKSERMTAGLLLQTAYYNTFFTVRLVYYSIGQIFSGNVAIRDMAGPVGIVSEMHTMAKTEMPVLNMLNLMGMIAVNLGVMNLLPFPALDGGRMFFILAGMVCRKPLKPEHEGIVHFIGLAILLLFMVAVTFSDITKLFV